jgi:Flp pilus assembly protein TadD
MRRGRELSEDRFQFVLFLLHREQLALAEKEKHPFAAAFHQSRLAGFEPWDATLRLKEAEAWAKAGQSERAARAFLQAIVLDPRVGQRPR